MKRDDDNELYKLLEKNKKDQQFWDALIWIVLMSIIAALVWGLPV